METKPQTMTNTLQKATSKKHSFYFYFVHRVEIGQSGKKYYYNIGDFKTLNEAQEYASRCPFQTTITPIDINK